MTRKIRLDLKEGDTGDTVCRETGSFFQFQHDDALSTEEQRVEYCLDYDDLEFVESGKTRH